MAQTPTIYKRILPLRPSFADSIPNAAHAPIRSSIADAEAEGAVWVRRTELTFQPATGGAEHWVDAAPRKCVRAGSGNLVRSGGILIGGEISGPPAGREVKIWWEPMHPAESFSLVVRGAKLGPASDTLRYANAGWAVGGSPKVGLTGPIFYASGIAFPSAGQWLLIATSGPDWGCFLLSAY
jgi:hypothetical protein